LGAHPHFVGAGFARPSFIASAKFWSQRESELVLLVYAAKAAALLPHSEGLIRLW
jgi:hypothetical protein